MRNIGLFTRRKQPVNETASRVQMVVDKGNGFYAWDGKIYQSDIVRACMRPKVKAVGKLVGKHIRETVSKEGKRSLVVNPEPYMRFLLEEPNPHMSGQKLQEKLAAHLILNKNAFALIVRDENDYPIEIYPISALGAEAIYDRSGELFLKFTFRNGKTFTFPYRNIIHLREDFNDNDIFGAPLAPALAPLMEIVSTTDQGIVKAIRNSSVIRWLLKYQTSMRPEDVEESTKKFAESFLSIENGGYGVAGVDAKADAEQIKPNDYVPNAAQMDRTKERIYALFNTNEKIVTSAFTENEWNSYYEAEIEPVVVDLKHEYTRKLFTRKERGFGNSIVFEASNLACASVTTKLALVSLLDRGVMNANEIRDVFNWAPVEGGDEYVRRLDTAPIDEGKVKGGDEEE